MNFSKNNMEEWYEFKEHGYAENLDVHKFKLGSLNGLACFDDSLFKVLFVQNAIKGNGDFKTFLSYVESLSVRVCFVDVHERFCIFLGNRGYKIVENEGIKSAINDKE
jgi:hypothetical protein